MNFSHFRILFYLLFIVSFQEITAQENYVDSLELALRKTTNDTVKLHLLEMLSDNAPDGIWEKYNEELGKVSLQLISHKNQSVRKKALRYLAVSYNNVGYQMAEKGNYQMSLLYFDKCRKIQEQIDDKKNLGLTYNSIGGVYDRNGDTAKALINFKISLRLEEKVNNLFDMTATLSNIGVQYKKRNQSNISIQYFLRSLKICEKIKIKNHVYVNLLNNIGIHFLDENDVIRAKNYFTKGLAISVEIGDKSGEASNSRGLSTVYLLQKNLSEALKLAERSINTCNLIQNKYEIEKSARLLKTIYIKKNNYKKAYEMFELEKNTRDSLANQENQKAVLRHQFKYEFESMNKLMKAEQAKKIAIAKAELQKQKVIRNSFIGGFALMLLLAVVVIVGYTQKQKANVIITQQKLEMEKQRDEAERQRLRAEESEKFEQQFLANMSHEIRTPMNAVMGMTNLLLDKNPRTDQLQYLSGIQKSSETLLHIINDILDLSKVEAGKIELEQIDFSLSDVVLQIKNLLLHKAEEKGIQLISNIDTDVPEILVGDPIRLNQILMNLCGNAIKFTDKGSVCLSIKKGGSTKLVGENRRKLSEIVHFSIEDTGVGIPKDKLKTVFESFSQAHTSDTRRFGGTGLGLSISKQLVELHGSSINIESELGSGSKFSFEIEYKIGSKDNIEAAKKSEQIDGSILNGLKIILADDNEYNRTVARDTLQSKADVEIAEAINGKEVIELLKKQNYDVVLMDVQMPVMDGYEATRQIRGYLPEPQNKIPIIALTASVIRSDLDKCRQAGMTDYVPKPFKTSHLITAIANAANRQIIYSESQKSAFIKEIIIPNSVTNLTYLEKFCESDKERMRKYIGMFLKTAPTLIQQLQYALEIKNNSEIATQIHAYKTKWIMMGMAESKELALRIEIQCHENSDEKTIAKNVSVLIEQINSAVTELNNFVT